MMFVDLPFDVFKNLVKEWIELKHVVKLNSAISSNRDIFNKSIHIESKVLQNIHSGLLHVEIIVTFPQLRHVYSFVPIYLKSVEDNTIEMLSHKKTVLFHLAKFSSLDSFASDCAKQRCEGDWRAGDQSCSKYINSPPQANSVAAKWVCSLKVPQLTGGDYFTGDCTCGCGYEHDTITLFNRRCSCHVVGAGTFEQPTINQFMGLLLADYPAQFAREFVAQFVTPPDAGASERMESSDRHFVKVKFYLPSTIPASTSFPAFSSFVRIDKFGRHYYQTVMAVAPIHLRFLQTTMAGKTGFKSSRTLHVSNILLIVYHTLFLNSTEI